MSNEQDGTKRSAGERIGVESKIDALAKRISNLKVIVGLLFAIVVAAFLAGLYFANTLTDIRNVLADIEALKQTTAQHETAIAEVRTSNGALRQDVATAFGSFRNGIVPAGDPMASTEPPNDGGGTKPVCTGGTVVVGLQLFKDTNGQRTIWIQCGKFGDVALN